MKGIVENIASSRQAAKYAAANKGYELLGRYKGMFTDKIEVKMGAVLQIVEEIIDAPGDSEAHSDAPGAASLPAK